jgi:hypothetical protein
VFTTALADDAEVQPSAFLTVKVYEPARRFSTVNEVPNPVDITPPGFLVKVHSPEAGSPVSCTLPVETLHVGWIIVPTAGAVGVTG